MTSTIQIDGGALTAYEARPEGRPKGAVVVIHEIWGLVPHITSIADRFAGEGYLAVAPDLLTGIGIPPEVGLALQPLMFESDDAKRTAAQPILREKLAPLNSPEFGQWAIAALKKVVDYLDAEPEINGRIAVVGFCFGGTYSFALAAADARVLAAVPYYGAPPESTEISAIVGSVLALYGQNDPRLIDGLPAVTAAMTAAGVDFSAHVYEGAGHAFFNDSNPITYREDAAEDAWARTLHFLEVSLT